MMMMMLLVVAAGVVEQQKCEREHEKQHVPIQIPFAHPVTLWRASETCSSDDPSTTAIWQCSTG